MKRCLDRLLKQYFNLRLILISLQIFPYRICLLCFYKLILPILTYGSEISGFSKPDAIERIHLQFCKHLLWIKIQTQNNFIYRELARVTVRNHRLVAAILQKNCHGLSLLRYN